MNDRPTPERQAYRALEIAYWDDVRQAVSAATLKAMILQARRLGYIPDSRTEELIAHYRLAAA